MTLLEPHAVARGISANVLVRRLVETAVDEAMIDAILDDGGEAETEVNGRTS